MKTKLFSIIFVLLISAGCATSPAALVSTSTPSSVQIEAPAAILPEVLISTPTQAEVEVVPHTPEPTATEAPAIKNANDQCKNPYYPVVDGATWTYEGSTIGQFNHTLNVSQDQLFTILITSNDTVFNMEGQCTEDGVILMDSGMSTTAQSSDGSGSVTTTNQDGVTLPNDIQVGDDWSQTIAYNAGSSEGSSFSGTIETSYKAVGYESVSVPAGTFEALKIIQNTTMTIAGTSFDTSSNLWYVQDVGNIKTEQIVGGGVSTTSELVSYNIP
jgi:hypothetical protein